MTLRAGLLDGRRIAMAAGSGGLGARLTALGAAVEPIAEDAGQDEQAAAAWVGDRIPLHGLVLDAGPAFGRGAGPGLRDSLRSAWLLTRAVAVGALIPAPGPTKIVLIAPRAGSGPHAEASRAGLVNLARTLSVEWARFALTTATLLPGGETPDEQVADLACFLLSAAGDYFSGCRFDLGTVPLSG